MKRSGVSARKSSRSARKSSRRSTETRRSARKPSRSPEQLTGGRWLVACLAEQRAERAQCCPFAVDARSVRCDIDIDPFLLVRYIRYCPRGNVATHLTQASTASQHCARSARSEARHATSHRPEGKLLRAEGRRPKRYVSSELIGGMTFLRGGSTFSR